MSGIPFVPPRFIPVNSAGRTYPGSKLHFFAAGTETRITVYTNASLGAPASNPMTADAGGQFAAVYLDPTEGSFKAVLKNSAGAQLWSEDNIPASSVSASQVGLALYPRSDAEITAGVTPSYYNYPLGDVRRYGFLAYDTTSDQSTALNNAYLVAVQEGGGIIEIPESDFRAAVTIAHQGIVFRGKGGIGSQTIWRNFGATAPVTFNNFTRGIVGSGLERIALYNRDSEVYTTTDGIVLDGEASGLLQMDYLSFKDVYIYGFRDNINITGRMIWCEFDRVRCSHAIRDGLHIEGTDNISQNSFRNCRFGNSGRHGVFASLTFSGLLATGNTFDTCTIEQNEQNGVRITGAYGLAGMTFNNCYMEENAGGITASSTSPRKVHVHVDSVYALGLEFDGCVFYANSAPDVNIDHGIYVDTATTVNVSGRIDGCRFLGSVVKDVYWPANVYLGQNVYSTTNTYTPSAGSVSLADQQSLTTWTPGVAFGGAAVDLTYTTQVGRYTVHGRLVTATGYIVISDNGSSSGAATITGLPHTATNVTNLFPVGAVSAAALGASTEDPVTMRVVPNTTTATLWQLSSGTITALTETELANGAALAFTVSYFV